ncbi:MULTISPECIES: H-NS family nucleoid-associated regulatory protein [unclassified Burkholderia]|uniref:H-NS histone family protein n=1 Tax=unclassified Burkholderia TaxID=2613784 RepID=UPI0007531EE9|nr:MULTISPECIES: H-NS histone family protein [unclassified Burkholderia]KUY50849.1 H-NS histone [Burkholderia sp. RF2-non_BP3]KUY80243.1 H-NS histone [Burkholderia sp. RF4-BP95]KUY95640.1 H-NS histone [Burkholderia sp. RF7-non_BP1]KUY98943.1 H-NS histone [Burkholderia sp. RF7-non_BP4]
MKDYEQLKAQAEALAREVERVQSQERDVVLSDVRAKVEQYGLQVVEIYGRDKLQELQRQLKPRKIAPKYRDPDSGATWTGRGLEPRWIRGRNRQEFLIGLGSCFAD